MYHVECELSNVHFINHLIPHSLLVLRSALFLLCTNLSPLPAHAHERNYALDENLLWWAYPCVRSPHLTGRMAWLLQMLVSPLRLYKRYLKNGLLKAGSILIHIPGFVAVGRARKGR